MQKINDTNQYIYYKNMTYNNNFASYGLYNGDAHVSSTSTNFNIDFSFIGTSLNIFFMVFGDRCNSIKISIDNLTPEYFSTAFNNSNASSCVYSKTGLSNTYHKVNMTSNSSNCYSIFDRIEIDSTGQMVPNELFLIKDGLNICNINGDGLTTQKISSNVARDDFINYGFYVSFITPTIISKISNQKYNIELLK